jgi:hypothetical protein
MATARRPYGFGDSSKKHDDFSRKDDTSRLSSMLHTLVAVRKRRIILSLLAIWLLYLFIKNIPTDVPPVSERIDPRFGRLRPQAHARPQEPIPPNQQQPPVIPLDQQYDGPIKFFKLGGTLKGFEIGNQNNVFFAFSSPKSASSVLTAACAMASHNRTRVHVSNMGRKDMAMSDILALNGISQEDCPIRWHDAQPDFAVQSTQRRMQTSCEAALGHIHRALALQAVFIDTSSREDEFLTEGLRSRTNALSIPFIRVPEADSWMLTLDTRSLRQWGHVQVDILIQAPKDSSSSLLRLLRTIRDADYNGLVLPRVTLELPSSIDSFITRYLYYYRWPPGSSAAESKLIVRHRVDSQAVTPATASSRFIESFYPTRPGSSHVLVLSPNVELSSKYYQYLMYMLMEYKYGAKTDLISSRLMGISLAGPSTDMKGSSTLPISLWQAPSADAILYFGDAWVELHEFATRRLSADPEFSQTVGTTPPLPAKWPAWLRMAMEWMQISGKFGVYPNLKDGESPFVTMHSELHQPPEEYGDPEATDETADISILRLGKEGDTLTAGSTGPSKGWEDSMLSTPSLTEVLGMMKSKSDSLVPDQGDLTTHDYAGEAISWKEVQSRASDFGKRFSQTVGKCSSSQRKGSVDTDGIDFLFCEDQSDAKT